MCIYVYIFIYVNRDIIYICIYSYLFTLYHIHYLCEIISIHIYICEHIYIYIYTHVTITRYVLYSYILIIQHCWVQDL